MSSNWHNYQFTHQQVLRRQALPQINVLRGPQRGGNINVIVQRPQIQPRGSWLCGFGVGFLTGFGNTFLSWLGNFRQNIWSVPQQGYMQQGYMQQGYMQPGYMQQTTAGGTDVASLESEIRELRNTVAKLTAAMNGTVQHEESLNKEQNPETEVGDPDAEQGDQDASTITKPDDGLGDVVQTWDDFDFSNGDFTVRDEALHKTYGNSSDIRGKAVKIAGNQVVVTGQSGNKYTYEPAGETIVYDGKTYQVYQCKEAENSKGTSLPTTTQQYIFKDGQLIQPSNLKKLVGLNTGTIKKDTQDGG